MGMVCCGSRGGSTVCFLVSVFFCCCLNSQGIVNTLVTPNGFFVKFQGASVLCLLSELCLLLHLFLLVAPLTCQRTPILLEADVSVAYAVPHTRD